MKFLTDLLGRKPVDLSCKNLPQVAEYLDLSLSKVLSTTGTTTLLQSTGARIEIYDMQVQAQGLQNTIQVFAGNRAVSALLTLNPNQGASFSGINLHWPDLLTIVLGNANPVDVAFRYRIYQR